MTPSEIREKSRAIVREMMSQIPLPDQEEIVEDVFDILCHHNILRAATIGEVVRRLLEGALENVEPRGVVCEHPDEYVECIANLEYPGGTISWCRRCGAWKDDEECEWHTPERKL